MIQSKPLIDRLSKADRRIFDKLRADHAAHSKILTAAQEEKGSNIPWRIRERQKAELAELRQAMANDPTAKGAEALRDQARRHALESGQADKLRQAARDAILAYRPLVEKAVQDGFKLVLPAAEKLLNEYTEKAELDRRALGVTPTELIHEIEALIRGLRLAIGEIPHKEFGEVPTPASGWLFGGQSISASGTTPPPPPPKAEAPPSPEDTGTMTARRFNATRTAAQF